MKKVNPSILRWPSGAGRMAVGRWARAWRSSTNSEELFQSNYRIQYTCNMIISIDVEKLLIFRVHVTVLNARYNSVLKVPGSYT